jgi:hypothetical protein
LPTFLSRKKWGRNPEVAKLRVSFFETESFQTTPSLRATRLTGTKDKVQRTKDKGKSYAVIRLCGFSKERMNEREKERIEL